MHHISGPSNPSDVGTREPFAGGPHMSAREARLMTGNILRKHPGFQDVVAADDIRLAGLVEDHLKANAMKDKAASRAITIAALALPLRKDVEMAIEAASASNSAIPIGAVVYRLKASDKQLFAQGTFATAYEGPFMVMLVLSDVSYSILDLRVQPSHRKTAYSTATRDQLRRADTISNYHLTEDEPTDILIHRTHPGGQIMFLVAWPADHHLSCFGWLSFAELSNLAPRLLREYCDAEKLPMPKAKSVSWLSDAVANQDATARKDTVNSANEAPDSTEHRVLLQPKSLDGIDAWEPETPALRDSNEEPLSPDPEEDGDTFEIEAILDHTEDEDGTMQFKVRWRGYDPSFDLWIPDHEIIHSGSKLYAEYMGKINSKPNT
jgi:hypothetical protein